MKNKILVIDDDETVVALIESFLKPEGYEITSTSDGEGGLELAEHGQPDAILLDQKMHGMGGHDVLKNLKKQQSTRDIPVIIITGDKNLRRLALGLDLGAQDYILKPFNNLRLLTRIHNVLG